LQPFAGGHQLFDPSMDFVSFLQGAQKLTRPVACVLSDDFPRTAIMGDSVATDVTRLLHDWRAGDREALARLIPVVYPELRALASRQLAREWRHDRFQTTALVHEAYVKLFGQRQVDWQNRGHFFALAAQLMRRIIVDSARRERRDKRGGGVVPATLDDAVAVPLEATDPVDALDLDRALQKLERFDPDQAQIVELRFFAGLTVEETAAALGISPATVKREWAIAKGWLYRELTTGARRPKPASA
jgi:RNA polymerase sigma-70 factor (ECF subfamily)